MRHECRIPMTPHVLLNPNAILSKKQRNLLPYPMNLMKLPVIKSIYKRDLRECSKLSATQALGTYRSRDTPPTILGPVVVDIVVAWEKGRQIVDWDNCVAMMKGVIDGVTKGGFMLDDRQVVGMYLQQIRDPDKLGYIDIAVCSVDEYTYNHEKNGWTP